MKRADVLRLTLLAAIWGASFMFMRVLAPALGPFATACLRVLIAGLVSLGYLALIGFDTQLERWRGHYVVIGVLNAAVPFLCFAFAALHLPAGYSAILNATTPFFGVLFAAIWLGDALTWRKAGGLALGAVGVVLVVRLGAVRDDPMFIVAVGVCLLAACCYGLSGTYLKKRMVGAPALGVAAHSQWMAGLMLAPGVAASPPHGTIGLAVVGSMLGLSLLCSAFASVLYYRLIADVGPSKALTVTFLIPVFAMLWAWLFLGEAITAAMLLGCVLVISGTALIVRQPAKPTLHRSTSRAF